MRLLLLALFLSSLASAGLTADVNVVQTFDGAGSKMTPSFQVADDWAVQWDFKDPYLLTVLASDGTRVASVSDALKGSLSLPKGGSYQLQIDPASDATKLGWHLSVIQNKSAPPKTVAASSTPTLPDSSTSTNLAPSLIFPSTKNIFPNAPIPATAGLTADQAHAVVLIKGDVAEGTGFLVKTVDGPMVVTNLHVISANPNVKITTTTGAQIKTLGLKGASDRDLAMFSIQDDHYTYLDLAADVQSTAQAGDEVITPGNSEGGEVMLDTKGKLLGIGPERVEFDNPIYHGNSGGPVFHTNSGKVLAVVTQALKVDTNNELDKASFDNKNSAITGTMRYFGLRLDTVPKWEVYDPAQFLAETTFLKTFHDQSRCLDSFLNGARYEKAHLVSADEFGPPDSHYFLHSDKVATARDNYHKMSTDTDASQNLDAARELTMDLEGIADADMATIQNSANFYSFDEIRAQYEIKYRKELRTEIENIEGKISDLGH